MKEQAVIHSESLEELDQVKQSYFFTVAVAAKLNHSVTTGNIINVNISQMYDQVLTDQIPWQKWSSS